MRFLLPAALAVALMAGSGVSAQTVGSTGNASPGLTEGLPNLCADLLTGPYGPGQVVDAADSRAFATAWLPPFSHLTAAIPALSPHEDRWLEEETKAATGISNPDRWYRAMNSREASMQQPRESAVALEALMRSIIVERDNAVLIRRWLTIIRVLMESAPEHLTRLVAEKVIPRKALPEAWLLLVKEDDVTTLRAFILNGRDTLIYNIVVCTLPSLGIGDIWTLPPPPP
jgi:hypothetical protein